MLKSLFKKKNVGPTAEEILALSASRAALVDRAGAMLNRLPPASYQREMHPIYGNPLEEAA